MELKDITVDAAKDVRGGSNSISQSSYNGPATGVVSVAGGAFNGSPVTVSSSVVQANLTQQAAAIHDIRKHDTLVNITGSQLFSGFGFWN